MQSPLGTSPALAAGRFAFFSSVFGFCLIWSSCAPCPLCLWLFSASLGEVSISHHCFWALVMDSQHCRAAFGVLYDTGGGRALEAHLNAQSLDFLTCITILVYLGLMCYGEAFKIMMLL